MAFTDKVCFVAGGCGTIGSGIVLSLLQEGANVVVNSRSASRLDDLQKTVPANLKRRLSTIQEDCSAEDAVKRIKDFILKEYGRVDHVVSSLGSVWQKGLLTDQTVEEFQSEIQNGAGTHFLVAKTFLPYLSEREGATYTFISGAAGENCFYKMASLLTVKTACLFGVAEAARAQFKENKVSVGEIRIGLFVQQEEDVTFGTKQTEVGKDFMGRVCTSIIRHHHLEIVRVNSRDQMNQFLKV